MTWPADFAAAVFTIGPDGRALSLSVDWDGGTEFKRVEDKPLLKGEVLKPGEIAPRSPINAPETTVMYGLRPRFCRSVVEPGRLEQIMAAGVS